ncbi:CHAD domain-containing protein [Paraburkholderia sp. GAS448]|uniref:CHAD domain-containing protein n=1 Tax=Paraburkholderia sp. GAS448 TaxID=3035136 RepID=UPI003D1BCF11
MRCRRSRTRARQQLESHIASPMLTEFAQERVELAEKALKKKVKRAIQPEHPGYGALHEVRIAGKKLRYLLEFFSPVLASSDQSDARAGGAPHKFNRFSHLSRLLENCPQACKQILWTSRRPCPSSSIVDAERRLPKNGTVYIV